MLLFDIRIYQSLIICILLYWISPIYGQNIEPIRFKYTYDSGNGQKEYPEPAILHIKPLLGLERKNSKRHEKVPIPSSNPIPVYSAEATAIYLDFEFLNLVSSKITLTVKTSGSFEEIHEPITINVRTNRAGRGNKRNKYFRFKTSGKGTLKIKLSGEVVDGINDVATLSREFSYEIISYNEKLGEINNLLNTTRGPQELNSMANLYSSFSDWNNGAFQINLQNIKGGDQIDNARLYTLPMILDIINQRHNKLLSEANKVNSTYESIKAYYDLFGCWEYNKAAPNDKIIASKLMNEKALQEWKQLNDKWKKLDNYKCQALNEYVNKYCELDCDIAASVKANCQKGEVLIDSCKRPPPPLPIDPCKQIGSSARFSKNINKLNSLLSKAYKNNCTDHIDLIKVRIEQVQCEILYNQMAIEENLLEKRLLLNRLANCNKYKERAQELLAIYAPIKFVPPNKPTLLNDENDRLFYRFSTEIESGYDIQLISINGHTDSSYLDNWTKNMLFLKWFPQDSIAKQKDSLIIDIFDISHLETADYSLVFKAASGELDTMLLPLLEFKLLETDTTQQKIILALENGYPPFYAVLTKGDGVEKEIHRLPLMGTKDTIDRLELAQIFRGTYQLEVRDKNGRTLTVGPLTFSRAESTSLWVWLLIPLIPLIVFLGYRNIGQRLA